jgi:hypothetical protein
MDGGGMEGGGAMKSRRRDFENARLKDENVNLNGEVGRHVPCTLDPSQIDLLEKTRWEGSM